MREQTKLSIFEHKEIFLSRKEYNQHLDVNLKLILKEQKVTKLIAT